MENKMKIKAVLFDLDGTLLPMKQEDFVKAYFGGIAKRLAPRGYQPQSLINAIYKGTGAMVLNNSQYNNESVFWNVFAEIFGEDKRADIKYFDEYYTLDFDDVKNVCGFNKDVSKVVKEIKDMGFRVALATNPIFPAIATRKRIQWTGLQPEDFEFITTYENSNRCKPNLEYYKQILAKLKLSAEECLMVGNDVDEDMVAKDLGMHVFLLTDNVINKNNLDTSVYPQGGFVDLMNYIKEISKD